MKTKVFLIIVLTILIGVCPAQADTVWTTGHHEIVDGDWFGELRIYNDVTVDMFGGRVEFFETYDTSMMDIFAGEIRRLQTYEISKIEIFNAQIRDLFTNGNSAVNIHNGLLEKLKAEENSLINIYAYDITHTTTGGYWDDGQLIGKYYGDNSEFVYDLFGDTYSHITIVPEPSTILLFSLGVLLLRKRK